MRREVSRNVCDGLVGALRRYGLQVQILTDNGKVFTGRFNHPPVEMLFASVWVLRNEDCSGVVSASKHGATSRRQIGVVARGTP